MSLGLRGGRKLHGVMALFADYCASKLKEVVQHAHAYAAEQGLEATLRITRSQTQRRISFHPAAQDIILSFDAGYVVMDARTIEVGPGYHAFVVGFVDYLSRHHQWVWDFDNAKQGFSDDTGYYRDRDFGALETAMAGTLTWLRTTLLNLEDAGNRRFYLALPLEFNIDADFFAATSLGFRDRAFFDTLMPERFFPWWQEGVGAQTLRNVALCKMWLETVWLPPADEEEKTELENCQSLIDRAIDLGARFAGHEGVDDIAALLRGEALDEPLGAGNDIVRIGYARQPTRYFDYGDWSVSLPAYYLKEMTEDGETCTLVYGDRAVHMKSFVFDEADGQFDWLEGDAEAENGHEYLRFETDSYRAIVRLETSDEDGRPVWIWKGRYQSPDGLAHINAVSYGDDAAWAERVLRSVQPPSDTTGGVTTIEF